MADALGVTRQAVSQWEAARTFPAAGKLSALCDLLQVSSSELILEPQDDIDEGESPAARPNSVAYYRKLAGLSQQELGEKVGIHWVTLSKVENGKTKSLRWNQMVQIGEVLGVEPAALAEAR